MSKTDRAYYNEIEPYAAEWLRNLIKEGHIAPGDVDTRSIVDVRPADLAGYTQCHFFAGLGGWSGALRLAAWSDHRPVWTGSCPCQPFSLAGKQGGFADERHLWPFWHYLIAQCRPPVVYGEQVASASQWLGLVRGDLEALDYAMGAIPVEAASAGADHLRDRYWFVGHNTRIGWREGGPEHAVRCGRPAVASNGSMEHAEHSGREGRYAQWRRTDPALPSGEAGLADSDSRAIRYEPGWSGGASWPDPGQHRDDREGPLSDRASEQVGRPGQPWQHRHVGDSAIVAKRQPHNRGDAIASGRQARPVFGGASDHEWVIGADGKARRVSTDIRGLVDGLSDFLAGLRAGCYAEAEQQMRDYGQATSTRPAEVLRAVWERVLSEPASYETMGEPSGVRGAEILLPFLCELGQRIAEKTDSALPSSQELDDEMRSLRFGGKFARPPLRRGYSEQRAIQHSDALHSLSWLLAQHARTAWEAHRRQNAKALRLLEHNVLCRVAKLRALGNAIDLRPAAAFIKATM